MGAVGLKQIIKCRIGWDQLSHQVIFNFKYKPEDDKDIREVLYDMDKALNMMWKNASEMCRQ